MTNKQMGFLVLGGLIVADVLLGGAIRKQAASLGVSSGQLAVATAAAGFMVHKLA